jgi:hypothetical protein
MPLGSGTPGRNRRFSPADAISRTCSSNADHILTRAIQACEINIADAVAIAPSPIMAMCWANPPLLQQ